MSELRDQAIDLIKVTIPDTDNYNAGPTFEYIYNYNETKERGGIE